MTKPCKACKEEIDGAATKCPKCQAYQRWYRNPQMFPLLVMIPFLTFLFFDMSSSRTPGAFRDYADKLTVAVVDEKPAADNRSNLVTVRLDNRTSKTWKRPKFQIESLDGAGNVVSVEHQSEYNMVVAPNSSAMDTLSLRIRPAVAVAKRRVILTDIDSNRY